MNALFRDFAAFVTMMGRPDRDKLSSGSYLEVLEPFLEQRELREQGKLEAVEVQGGITRLAMFWVVVVNMSGQQELPIFLKNDLVTSGLCLATGSDPLPGYFCVMDKPPKTGVITSPAPTVLIVVPPAESVPDKHQLRKMHESLRRLTVANRIDVEAVEQWRIDVEKLPVPEVARPAEKPRRLVVAVACLPPGGGKSTFMHRVAAALGESCQVVSSDYVEGFDEAVVRALKTHQVVCYDKNVPAVTGMQKLQRVFSKAAKDYDLRFALVAPDILDETRMQTCWRRITARAPSDDKNVLTVHSLGEAKAWSVFKDNFFASCEDYLPCLLSSTAVAPTGLFWDESGGEAAVEDLVDRLGWKAFVADDVRLPSTSICLHELPCDAQKPAGSWASAEVPGTTLHMTLVPPPARGANEEAAAVRGAVLKELGRMQGRRLRLELSGYHLAVRDADALHADRAESCGFWEVSRVDGLPEEAQFEAQCSIYHVTDRAALGGGRQPRTSADLLRELRGLGPTELRDQLGGWTLRHWSFESRLEVDAVVTLHG